MEEVCERGNCERALKRVKANKGAAGVDGMTVGEVPQWLLKLIREFLTAGVMENGLVSAVDQGTPQGGPLSPLLSNIVLDELDR